MWITIGLEIVILILWIITQCIIAEQQEIQDEYNKLFTNEIYKLKKNQGIEELKKQIEKVKRED